MDITQAPWDQEGDFGHKAIPRLLLVQALVTRFEIEKGGARGTVHHQSHEAHEVFTSSVILL